MINSELAFKFSLVLGSLLFVLILVRTGYRDKKRPLLIFGLYGGYVLLQCFAAVEFFPFTVFPARSKPESRTARYIKVIKVVEGGNIYRVNDPLFLRHFSGGCAKRQVEKIFQNENACARYAKKLSVYEFSQNPTVGRPTIKRIHVELWKWNWLEDPRDTDYGFFEKRLICKA